jgi:group II intron reverse transcriptase/maturase
MRSAQTYIEIVRDRGRRNLPLQRVYRNLQNRELFLMAYAKLYANKGATTKGVDSKNTVDGMSLKRIDNIIARLREGTYQWQPARRAYIDKKNGKKRPLGLPGWDDKLLQQVIKMILEAYYEPRFSDHSHGFRPGRGCHTALREVYVCWKGTKWFIEGDIKGFYDNINHDVLLGILERDIKDKRFLKLIRQLLKAGYIEDWQFHKTYSGVPQGSVIGPLLANLVLNDLDQFVEEELFPQFNKGKEREKNPEYRRLSYAMTKARREENTQLYRQLKKQRQQLPNRDPYDPHFRRLKYVRYCDDFLLGYAGTRQEAVEIKQRIQEFLSHQLKLTLSEEKTLVTHATNGCARFLNYEIYIGLNNTKLTNNKKNAKRVGRSLNQGFLIKSRRATADRFEHASKSGQ